MAYTCNLGPRTRIGYIVVGAGLIVLGWWWGALRPVWPLALGLWGFIVVLEGAVGF